MSTTRARILAAFRALLRRTGRPPTVRELGIQVGLKSTRTVHDHLKALEAEGLLIRRPGARGLALPPGTAPGAPETRTGVPILGRVAAGAPLMAERNLDGELDLGSFFGAADGLFVLKVQGDSMLEAGIHPDDYVVVRAGGEVPEGAIGVAAVDGEVTVKRLARRGQVLWLHPANPAYRPIAVDLRTHEAQVIGRVVGVVRQVS